MPKCANLLRQYRGVREYQIFVETDIEEIQVIYQTARSLFLLTIFLRYTMYNVNVEQLRGSAWQKSTALVVVHGNIPENVAPVLISYLVAGKKTDLNLC